MNKSNILLCGLPGSGKSTYLGALWFLLFDGEITTELSLVDFPTTRDYLNRLSKKWSRFIEIDRTTIDEIHEVSFRLSDGEIEADLVIPDMSGETWGEIWSNRLCGAQAAKLASDASGIMLFVHADKIDPPLDIVTQNAMIADDDTLSTDETFESWTPGKSPLQVRLTDIVQALSSHPLGCKGRRIAVIISAWDKADATNLTPDEYFKVYLPLLCQYLKFSGDFSEVKIYGVSAQGGDLQSPEDAARLKAENEPSKRIRMVEGGCEKHDLTIPVKWLMSK